MSTIMHIQDVLIVLIGLLIVWEILEKIRLFRKMAPGPYGIPIVGSMIHLLNTDVIDEFQKYKKKYGQVFPCLLATFIVTDWRLIIENVRKDEFQGRPDFEIWQLRNLGNRNRGVLVSDNPVWQEQRRFLIRGLRDFRKDSMEGMFINELRDLQATLRKEMGHPINLSGVFNAPVLNSLWFLVTGKRFELDDPKLKSLITLLIDNVQGVQLTSPVLFFYTVVKYGLIGRKQIKSHMKFRAQLREILEEVIDEHFERYEEGDVRDFMDAYIQKIKESSSKESSFYSEEGRSNLYAVLLDLFTDNPTRAVLREMKKYWNEDFADETEEYNLFQKRNPIKMQIFSRPDGIGLGLKTAEDIPKHTWIADNVGEVKVGQAPFSNDMTVQLDCNCYIDSSKFSNISRLFNHSCDPNMIMEPIWTGKEQHIILKAKSNILAGQELLWSYKFEIGPDGKNVLCNCKSKNCNGMMGSRRPKMPEKFICETCSKNLATKQSLSQHKMTHSVKRPHKCDKCDSAFKTKPGLLQHMVSHAEKNFVCEGCKATFGRESHLKRHQLDSCKTNAPKRGKNPIKTIAQA